MAEETNKKIIAETWTLPFVGDKFSMYVMDSEHHVCFNFLSKDEELYKRVIDVLNNAPSSIPFKGTGRDKTHIAVSDDTSNEYAKPILLVRGWGYLTGGGGLDLSYEEAVRRQDALLNYCEARLKGKDVE